MTMEKQLSPNHLLDVTLHTLLIALSLFAAFLLRFDFRIPEGVGPVFWSALWLAGLVKLPTFFYAGFHRGLRRFAGLPEVPGLLFGNLVASGAFGVLALAWLGRRLPGSIVLLDLLLCFLVTSLARFSERLYREILQREAPISRAKGILIYGAGAAGAALSRDIRANRSTGYEVLGFLDDNEDKRGTLIMGIPVLGSGREAAAIVERLNKRCSRIEKIVIAMPSCTGRQLREALANCRAARVPCQIVPGLNKLLTGKVLTAQIRDISVADLLGRKPVELDEAPIRSSLEGRSILVTGAAGSIGSELCRQIAKFQPAGLIAFDQAESELFKIEHELRERFPQLPVVAALGDVRNAGRMAEVMEQFRVESVFHAAAYKHVPMLESHVLEAVSTNILGTCNLLNAACTHGAANFVMISSDKAVNPTSVMGVTKRVCELLVCNQPGDRITKCVSVRFGNVLGSNGSVVPLFQAQIAAGGPVTVTHPGMQRYFMTISEAVSLVLQASTMGNGSEILVLDMGEPVRILDLALNMIRLAGLEPYEDVDIEFTGLRSGEKLFEEIRCSGENMLPTYHEKIRIFADPPMDPKYVAGWLAQLNFLLLQRNPSKVVEHLRRLVPEYRPNGHWSKPSEAPLGPTRERTGTGLTPEPVQAAARFHYPH